MQNYIHVCKGGGGTKFDTKHDEWPEITGIFTSIGLSLKNMHIGGLQILGSAKKTLTR